MAVLDPDIVWRSDGGGIVTTSRRPQHGVDKVARGVLALRVHAISTGLISVKTTFLERRGKGALSKINILLAQRHAAFMPHSAHALGLATSGLLS